MRQRDFDEMFRGQSYGLREDYSPRDWHCECVGQYADDIEAWVEAHKGNGSGGQHRFCVYAGTGSGKTQCAGHTASFLLNRRHADQVVVVCPNRSIKRKTRAVFREVFGIDLVDFRANKHREGIGRAKQGYILTYARLIQDPVLHASICRPDTVVIFDEIHHLGDRSGWGEAALEAFGGVRFVIALTGTPYRSDNRPIPFVFYDDPKPDSVLREFKADFPYSLGRAVTEGVCRKPIFRFHDATVGIRNQGAGERTVTFDDDCVGDQVSSLRLRGAVKYGSVARRELIRSALEECRREHRKVIFFVGGDTEGDHTPTYDATEYLPSEIVDLGYSADEIEIVTGFDKAAQEKIEKFGVSPTKWILLSVNMVSEGVDIPELSAAVFLTSITAKQTTVQRIGRSLRLMGPDDPHKDALIYMFQDPSLRALATEIETAIKVEVNLLRNRTEAAGETGDAGSPSRRTETTCLDGGRPTIVLFGGREFAADTVSRAQDRLREHGLPPTMLEAVLYLMLEVEHGNG
jgi:superfamily II DNA or RNA helicase